MINSRSLDLLDVEFRGRVYRWLELCHDAELDILVTSTYRDNEYQEYLYSLGRTRKGKICTNARAGQSKHNHKKALDFCIMDGKTCDWGNTVAFSRAGVLAESVGLTWAGRWRGKMRELGHIEL
jgi:peptidoglycan LD-endopeptidase CwlK